MVQRIDQQSNVFAHIAVDIVWTAQKFRCLLDQVGCEDVGDDAFLVRFVELLQTVCK